MAYIGDRDWLNIEAEITGFCRRIIDIIQQAQEMDRRMTVFAAGRNITQLATDLGVSEQHITDANAAITAMKKINDMGEGQSVSTANYFDDLRHF